MCCWNCTTGEGSPEELDKFYSKNLSFDTQTQSHVPKKKHIRLDLFSSSNSRSISCRHCVSAERGPEQQDNVPLPNIFSLIFQNLYLCLTNNIITYNIQLGHHQITLSEVTSPRSLSSMLS